MREILFRGKCTDRAEDRNGKWIEGFFTKKNSVIQVSEFGYAPAEISVIERKEVKAKYAHDTEYTYEVYTVDPETVGQFTGLTDKNGKKIFEGDIMRSAGNVVEFCSDGFCINGDSPLALWTKTEVIGNIHDNPELLDEK